MIQNNTLGDRLNSFKNKKDPSLNEIPQIHNSIFDAVVSILSAFSLVFKVAVFGYSAKLIFTTDWNILGITCIGLTINFMMTYIYDLFHNK